MSYDFFAPFRVIQYYPTPGNGSGLGVDAAKAAAWPPWAEEVDSARLARETWQPSGNERTRYFRVPYDKRYAFRDYCLGYPTLTTFTPPPVDSKVKQQTEEALATVQRLLNDIGGANLASALFLALKVSQGIYSTDLSGQLATLLLRLTDLSNASPAPSLTQAIANLQAVTNPGYVPADQAFRDAMAAYVASQGNAPSGGGAAQTWISYYRNNLNRFSEAAQKKGVQAVVDAVDALEVASGKLIAPLNAIIPELTAARLRVQSAYDAAHQQPYGFISRVPPVQDPENPHLFAVRVQLVEAAGKAVRARYLSAKQLAGLNGWKPVNTGDPVADAANQAFNDGLLAAVGVPPESASSLYDSALYVGDPPVGTAIAVGVATMEVVYRDLDYDVLTDQQADAWANYFPGQLGLPGTVPRELLRWVTPEIAYAQQSLPLAKIQAAAEGKAGRKQLQLQFVEDPYKGQTIPEPGALLLPTSTLQLHLRDWPCVPWDAIQKCRGKINSKPLGPIPRLGMAVFPAGTALCQPPTVRLSRRSAHGEQLFHIALRFDLRNLDAPGPSVATWNHFPCPDSRFRLAVFGGPTYVDKPGAYLYQSADLNQLLVPPSSAIKFP